jgi:hypothetical protein
METALAFQEKFFLKVKLAYAVVYLHFSVITIEYI